MTGERDFLVGKRVTVIGLGIEGVDVARYAATHGATVTVFDSKSPAALTERMTELEGLPIEYALGRPQRVEDIAQSDIIFASQSVPLTLPVFEAARERGVPVSSMTRYFLEHCPGPTIGITGRSSARVKWCIPTVCHSTMSRSVIPRPFRLQAPSPSVPLLAKTYLPAA